LLRDRQLQVGESDDPFAPERLLLRAVDEAKLVKATQQKRAI
jgi:hypothetical protein